MIEVEKLTSKSLAALLDSTYLKAFGGPEKIDGLCRAGATSAGRAIVEGFGL